MQDFVRKDEKTAQEYSKKTTTSTSEPKSSPGKKLTNTNRGENGAAE